MSKLAQLQQDFLTTFCANKADVFTQHIHNQTALTSEKRLAIYQGSITECLAKSLRETYEACEKLVGEDFFNGLAYKYIQRTPSQSPDLGNYGESFADFVEQFPPAQQFPYLADMCRLCWCYHLAYCTQSDAIFDTVAFAALSDEQQAQIIFELPRSTQFIESLYPLNKIWDLCQPEQASEANCEIDLSAGGVKLLIWRDQHQVKIEALNDTEWQLAKLLVQQLTLEQLEQHCASQGINLSELLPAFLTKGRLIFRNAKSDN